PHESFSFDSSDFGIYVDRIFWLIYPKAHEGRFFYAILDSRWNSNTASISVFGLLPSLLIFTKKGHRWIKWLTVLFAIIYITPFNGLFSLFTDCYYSRWAYAFTLAIITSTLFYIKDYGMPSYRYALYYCIVIYGFYFLFVGYSVYWQLHIGWNWMSESVTRLLMDFGLIVINAIALLLLCSNRKWMTPRYYATVICVGLCTAVQFLIYSIPEVMKDSPKGIVSTETDYFRQDLDHRVSGDFEYRTNFYVPNGGGHPGNNFGLICNRASINTYHSIQNSKILNWINIVGNQIDPRRVFYTRRFMDSFEALMSVKDHIVVMNEYTDTLPDESPAARDDAFYIYENRHYLPMGFTYDRYVTSDAVKAAMQKDDGFDTPLHLLSALMIDRTDEKALSPYLRPGSIDVDVSLDSVVNARRAITCDRFRGHTKGLDAHIDLDTTRVVFFSVLADDGFKAYIDGKQTKIYETNFGFSSLVVPAGSHDITFRYFPPGLKLGMLVSVIGFSLLCYMFIKQF
ncbi:MAG: YfhO family protein, partial [Muribaculaceae bacterium]|nr:YfhO family protein [Muribaculaceae bacterium]